MPSDLSLAIFQAIILSIMIVGEVGLLLYVVPGLLIIWLAGLVYGLVTGFSLWSGVVFGVMTVLLVGGSFVDELLMSGSARRTGASWWAVGISMAAGVAGSIAFPPFGGLVAAMVGLFLVEVIRLRDWRKALISTRGMALGCGAALFARLGIGFVMISLWVLWALVIK